MAKGISKEDAKTVIGGPDSREEVITIDPEVLPEGIEKKVVEEGPQYVDPFTLRSEYVDLVSSFISNQEELLRVESPKAAASEVLMKNYQHCIETLKRLRNFIATWDLEVYPEEDV